MRGTVVHANGRSILLALFWTLGLIMGIGVWTAAGDSLVSLMHSSIFVTVSIVRVIGLTCFPFLISAFAVSFSWSFLLFPIGFLKALFLAFISMGILDSFGCAGWLVCGILLFRSWVGVPLLYGFWLRHLSGDEICMLELFWLVAVCALLGSADYWIISPFLGRLIFW